MTQDDNPRIFISYSHRGKGPEWKAALLHALHVFEQHHLLDVWQDGKIRVSSFWNDDIRQAMSNARLAVVLLTKEALESKYILNTEFPFLRKRQQRGKLPVFPVVCEACDWKAHDWLRATQSPNESNPLSQLSESAQVQVFRKLATDIAEELSRIALTELPKPDQPPAPDHVYLERFPLTRGGQPEKLVGRDQELALLDLAFAQPHTAVVSLVAWGGVGKTMLVQHWLQRLQREGWLGVRRIYAWSFYSQGTKEDRQASEDTFLAHALQWFGVQCEPTLSPWDKGRLLADAVVRERTLLILDGIEPLQYPPGPMGGQFRAPGVQSLLKQLARKANDTEHRRLCLVTTRQPLTNLADLQRGPGAAWGSVLRVDLGNLTEEAGAALLHHAGAKRAGAAEINADDAELLTASRAVDGHALTLNLLGRFLARAHSGDIRRRDLVKFEEADRNVQGGTTFKMLAAFANWFARSGEFGARQLAILRILGLFEGPADAGCIAALRKPPVIVGLTEPLFTTRSDAGAGPATVLPLVDEDWNTAVSFLLDFGILAIQNAAENREHWLDCHPLVHEHFAKYLREQNPTSWRAGHRRLYEHLRDGAEHRPNTLEDLQPLYQAVAHGCHADLQQETCDSIYIERILRGAEYFSSRNLGATAANLAAVACFFDQPWSALPIGLPKLRQAELLNEAAFYLRALGRLGEAIGPMREVFEIEIERKDWPGAAQAANNLSELELLLGELPKAVRDAEKAVEMADSSGELGQRMDKRTALGDALHQTGRPMEALEWFRQAESLQAERDPQHPLLYSPPSFRFCDLLMAEAERSAWQHHMSGEIENRRSQDERDRDLASCRNVELRVQKTLEWVATQNWLVTIALEKLILGRATLYTLVLANGERERVETLRSACRQCRQLDSAVDDLRHTGQQMLLPPGLLSRAWLRFLQGDADGARADLDEVWDVAERGPMRLHQADTHLYRARLFSRERPYPWKSPQADLVAARRLIEQCGYWRRKAELEDAEKAAETW